MERNHHGHPERQYANAALNLETDIREEHDVAAQHPDIVKRFERLMKEARNGPDF
mgnify:CR=1 FL=1